MSVSAAGDTSLPSAGATDFDWDLVDAAGIYPAPVPLPRSNQELMVIILARLLFQFAAFDLKYRIDFTVSYLIDLEETF